MSFIDKINKCTVETSFAQSLAHGLFFLLCCKHMKVKSLGLLDFYFYGLKAKEWVEFLQRGTL